MCLKWGGPSKEECREEEGSEAKKKASFHASVDKPTCHTKAPLPPSLERIKSVRTGRVHKNASSALCIHSSAQAPPPLLFNLHSPRGVCHCTSPWSPTVGWHLVCKFFPLSWCRSSRRREACSPRRGQSNPVYGTTRRSTTRSIYNAVRATDIPSRLTALRFLQCKERIHLIKLSNISSFSFRAGLAARCSTPTRRPKHGQLWRLFVGRTVSCHAVTNPTHAAHCSCGRETARGSHRLHHPPTRLYLASEPSPVCHTPPFLHTHTHALSLSLSLSLALTHT